MLSGALEQRQAKFSRKKKTFQPKKTPTERLATPKFPSLCPSFKELLVPGGCQHCFAAAFKPATATEKEICIWKLPVILLFRSYCKRKDAV